MLWLRGNNGQSLEKRKVPRDGVLCWLNACLYWRQGTNLVPIVLRRPSEKMFRCLSVLEEK